jgi:hypothetical protein
MLTGCADIDSYEIQIDDGAGGAFVEVDGFTSPYTLNSITITDQITSGLTYTLRYRAHNIHGWGDFSNEVEILAATIPS